MYYAVVVGVADPTRERQRLQDEYSRMMDGELEQLATVAADLTDIARQVLQEQMYLRGLLQQSPQPNAGNPAINSSDPRTLPQLAAEDAGNQNDLCVVRAFTSFSEALIARGLLDYSGVSCHLADEITLGSNPMLSHALGGVRLFVRQSELNDATKLLEEAIPDSIEVPGVGKYVQPRCPQCYSFDITFGELSNAAKISLPLGLTLPVSRQEWVCHKCGARWSDSEQD